MRIGISTSVIQRGKTGVAQYVFALVRAFESILAEHRVTLFVLEEDLPLFARSKQAGMELVEVPERFRPPVKNILWHQAHLPGLAKRQELDVLHIPSYRRLLGRKPCALVGTIHDLAPFRVTKKYDWKRMFYGRVIVKRLARRQDRIIAISHNTASDITAFFQIPRERIQVVHNGIDHDRFHAAERERSRELIARKHRLDRPFFLYVARLEHPGKNHVRLISAFEEFKAATHANWQLVFGGSDWHGAEAIHQAIGRSPFSEDIRSLGFVAEEDLPDLYRAADVFVYPSLYEGFGLPPLEAMACGTPVIASPCGSLREVLGDAAAIVDPEDIHTIARQLYILATDAEARNRWRAAGLSQAQKFDWVKTASETMRVYQAAAGFST